MSAQRPGVEPSVASHEVDDEDTHNSELARVQLFQLELQTEFQKLREQYATGEARVRSQEVLQDEMRLLRDQNADLSRRVAQLSVTLEMLETCSVAAPPTYISEVEERD